MCRLYFLFIILVPDVMLRVVKTSEIDVSADVTKLE